jgi:hypothetical protein
MPKKSRRNLVIDSSYDRSFRRAQVHEHLRVTPAFARVIFGNKKKSNKIFKIGGTFARIFDA